MYRPDYPIITERLVLRPLDPLTDLDAVHAYQSREDVCRYIPYTPRTRDEVAELLGSCRNRSTLETPGQAITLGLELRATGQLVGDAMLAWPSEVHRRGEIGYVLHPDHQGHGYVTEACRALLGYAFDGMDLHRVVARIDERNGASRAVLERLGLRLEARLVENEWFKGEWTTELDFAVLADEWRKQQVDATGS